MYTDGYCSVSDFIPINGGRTYYISNADVAAFCWYNSEKQYISGERYDDRQQFITTAPQNAAYIRCTVTNETTTTTTRNIDTFKVTKGYKLDMLTQENLWTSGIEQGAISTSGVFSDNANRVRSVVYNLTSGESYTINCSQSIRVIYAYSYDGTTLSPVAKLLDHSATGKHEATFTMPSGANAIGIGIQNNEGSSVAIEPSDVSYKSLTTGNPTTTPIYIGSTALQKDEYVDSESGKVYRKVNGVNLFDASTLSNYFFKADGSTIPNAVWKASDYMSVLAGHDYFVGKPTTTMPTTQVYNCWYDANKAFISSYPIIIDDTIVTAPQNAAYTRVCVRTDVVDVNSYEFYESTLTPTDPPVALPQLPTIDGSTIIEVDSTIQPEKVSLTYRKEGF